MNFQNPEFPNEKINGALAVLTINLDLVGCDVTNSDIDVTYHNVSFRFSFGHHIKCKDGVCDGIRINIQWTKTHTKIFTISARLRMKTESVSLYYPDPIYIKTLTELPNWMSVGREVASKITNLTIYQD